MVPILVLSMSQMVLFKNNSYLIAQGVKILFRNNDTKNVNMNVQNMIHSPLDIK